MVVRTVAIGSIVVLASLVAVSGCKDSPKYPTAKAPPTLKNINRPVENDDQDLDDERDEGGDEESMGRRPVRGRAPAVSVTRAAAGQPVKKPKTVFTVKGAKSINGHPKGPRAEVFNAVLNSVFPRVSSCFQSQLDNLKGNRNSIRVRVRIANSGAVSEATVVSGTDNPSVDSCTVSALKSLKFPAYEGRPISQVVPFTFVKMK